MVSWQPGIVIADHARANGPAKDRYRPIYILETTKLINVMIIFFKNYILLLIRLNAISVFLALPHASKLHEDLIIIQM